MALSYRERIMEAIEKSDKWGEIKSRGGFEPLMTLYLTTDLKPSEIDKMKETQGKVVAVKLYPAGRVFKRKKKCVYLIKWW